VPPTPQQQQQQQQRHRQLLLNRVDRTTFIDRRPLLIASSVHSNPFVVIRLFSFKNHSETITESGQAVGSSRRLRSSCQQCERHFLLATYSSSSTRLRRDLASKQDNTSIDSSLATYASISFIVYDTFTLSTEKTDSLRICFAAVNLSFEDLDFPKTADVRRCASVVLPALSVGCGLVRAHFFLDTTVVNWPRRLPDAAGAASL